MGRGLVTGGQETLGRWIVAEGPCIWLGVSTWCRWVTWSCDYREGACELWGREGEAMDKHLTLGSHGGGSVVQTGYLVQGSPAPH